MLRYACAWLPLSLSLTLPLCSLSLSLSLRLLITLSSYVASLFLHLAHLSSSYSWLLCPLFFSFPRNLPRHAPSLSRPELLSSPSSSLSLLTTALSGRRSVSMCWLEIVIVVVMVAVVIVRRCRRSGGAGVAVGGGPVRREGKE